MKVVLVDARYIGKFIAGTRRQLRLGRDECASIFGISQRDLHKIENGSMLIPEKVLQKIIINGMTLILCRRKK